MGDLYLNIVESKNRDTGGFDRQSVILFAADLQHFLKGFDESLKVMEKAVREKKYSGSAKREGDTRGHSHRPEGGKREGGKFDGGKRDGDTRGHSHRPEGDRREGRKFDGGKREGGKFEGGRREGRKFEGGKREGGKREGGKFDGGKRGGVRKVVVRKTDH
jgi:hypothetical protein